MAIARTQAVSANANNVALSSTAAGDLIVVFAYSTTTTIPTIPAGFASIAATAGTQQAAACGYKFSAGGDTSSGTWTNAAQVVCMVFSGASLPGGTAGLIAGSSTTPTWNGHTNQNQDGTSIAVLFAGAKAATTGMANNPGGGGVTTRTNQTTVMGGDTGTLATTYGGGNTLTISPTSRWFTIAVEIKVLPAGPYFVGAGTSATGTSIINSVPLPAGYAINDILLLICQSSNEAMSLGGSGWAELDDQTHMATGTAATAGAMRLAVAWKRATSLSETAPGVSNMTGGNHLIAQVLAIRGCATSGNPWSDVGTEYVASGGSSPIWWSILGGGAQFLNGTSQTPTAIFSTTVNNSLVLWIGGTPTDNAAPTITAQANTLISGWRIVSTAYTATGTGGGFAVVAGAKATAGAVTDGSSNNLQVGPSAAVSASMALALKPVVTGPADYPMPAAQGTFAATGQAVGLIWGQRAIGIPAGSFAVAGQAVTMPRGKSMTLAQGAYALAGQAAGFLRARKLPVPTAGAFSLAGQATNLLHHQKIVLVQAGYAIAGQAANLIRGRLIGITQASYALAGQALLWKRTYKTAITAGAYGLTGYDVGLSKAVTARILTAVAGAFSLAGQAASLRQGRLASVIAGAFALAGQATGLRRARLGTVTPGAFSYAGQPASLLRQRKTPMATGAYGLNGQPAILLFKRTVTATQAGYILAGQAVTLVKVQLRTIFLSSGTFTMTGQAVGFPRGRRTPLAFGSFSYAGQPTNLLRGRRGGPVTGGFTIAGQAANLLRGRRVILVTGPFTIAGQPASLTRSRRMPTVTGPFALNGQAAGLKRGRTAAPEPGFYTLTGGDLLFISSAGETWIFRAGQVTSSDVEATQAESALAITGAASVLLAKIAGQADGQPVIAWPDSSPNGFHAAGVITRQPLFKRNILNGRAIMRFDGSDDLLVTVNAATAGITGAATIFIVQRTTVVQSSAALMAWQQSPTDQRIGIHLPWSDGNLYWDFGDAAGGSGRISIPWGGNTADFFIWTFRAGTGQMEIWRNGANIASVGGKTTFFTASGTVPFQIGGASGIAYQNSDMAEVIIFNVALPDTNRANAEKFLADYYGLSVAGGTASDPGAMSGLQSRWKADTMLGGILNAKTGSTLVGTPANTGSALEISVAQSALKVEKTE